jgi:hypothetical protein
MSGDQLLETAEPKGHIVQLYDADEERFARNVGHYLREGLKQGDGILVVATAEHLKHIPQQLITLGSDYEEAVREGWLVFLDAQETLDCFMVDGEPDWDLFEDTIGSALRKLRGLGNGEGLRVHGEMVGVLWKAGQRAAAIRLEKYWNLLLKSMTFNLFCAYPIDVFGEEFQMGHLDALLCAHTHLLPTGSEGDIESSVNRAMDDILGSRAERLRPLIKPNYRPAWAAMPSAEAMVLWLRNNLPDYAHAILDRAREHYHALKRPKTMKVGSSEIGPIN